MLMFFRHCGSCCFSNLLHIFKTVLTRKWIFYLTRILVLDVYFMHCRHTLLLQCKLHILKPLLWKKIIFAYVSEWLNRDFLMYGLLRESFLLNNSIHRHDSMVPGLLAADLHYATVSFSKSRRGPNKTHSVPPQLFLGIIEHSARIK